MHDNHVRLIFNVVIYTSMLNFGLIVYSLGLQKNETSADKTSIDTTDNDFDRPDHLSQPTTQ